MKPEGRSNGNELLRVEDLTVTFPSREGTRSVLSQISLSIQSGETLGLVGESGCGKSTLGRAIMRLVPPHAAVTGTIEIAGRDLIRAREGEIRAMRGGTIAMIFQNPMSALNPVLSIGRQITEALAVHTELRGKAATDRAVELLHAVGIAQPKERISDYPHQLSGGMRQRAMIAMAISCNPKLLIADEPTTALDLTVQAQILDLLVSLQEKLAMAVLFISHDMSAVASVSDRIAVMYAGRIVEQGAAAQLLRDPAHPYTYGLLNSVPPVNARRQSRLNAIPGVVSGNIGETKGCSFQPRCPFSLAKCDTETPPLVQIPTDRAARCWHAAADWRPAPSASVEARRP